MLVLEPNWEAKLIELNSVKTAVHNENDTLIRKNIKQSLKARIKEIHRLISINHAIIKEQE